MFLVKRIFEGYDGILRKVILDILDGAAGTAHGLYQRTGACHQASGHKEIAARVAYMARCCPAASSTAILEAASISCTADLTSFNPPLKVISGSIRDENSRDITSAGIGCGETRSNEPPIL